MNEKKKHSVVTIICLLILNIFMKNYEVKCMNTNIFCSIVLYIIIILEISDVCVSKLIRYYLFIKYKPCS